MNIHINAMQNLLVIVTIAMIGFIACASPSKKQSDTSASMPDSVVINTARAAFIYSMPLALIDLTRQKLTNYETPMDGRGAPVNQLFISSQFPDADLHDVVRPNADTYYNQGFLDLSNGPLVLNLPNTGRRYYLMPMLDAWTNVFISPGKRTTGTEEGIYLITGPQWMGTLPGGMKQINAPTNLVWILGRLQVNSPLSKMMCF